MHGPQDVAFFPCPETGRPAVSGLAYSKVLAQPITLYQRHHAPK